MKYIFFTYDGRGVPIAKHLLDEGNEVTLCLITDEKDISLPNEKIKVKPEEKEKQLKIGENILNRIPLDKLLKVLPSLDRKEYFLFFDDNSLFKVAEKVAPLGFAGNYPTKWDREMEIDRKKAKDFVKANYPKVKVAEYYEFKKIEEAKKFLEDTDKLWVLKGFAPDSDTVCPNINDVELAKEQIIEALETNTQLYEKEGFLLEEYIPNPIEITPEAVFYDGELLYTSVDLEYKKLGAGDVGYSTGCAADLVFLTPKFCPLNEIAFPEVVYKLAKQHKGLFIWDISLLVDKKTDTFYFGEFCPNRIGVNAFYTELTHLDTVSEYFETIVNHQNPFVNDRAQFASSITLFNLLTDKDTSNPKQDIKIAYPEFINPYIWLMDVYKKDSTPNLYYTIGTASMTGAVTGRGDTINESANNAYSYLQNVSMEQVYYRYKEDYLSVGFETSIFNRYFYLKHKKLIDQI